MKLYAHRGWTTGPGENGPAFFERAAATDFLDGVEFDIRRGADGELIVVHDPPEPGTSHPTFNEVLDILGSSGKELFVEIKEAGVGADVIATLIDRKLADRACVFGFPPVAAGLPFEGKRPVKTGLIAHLPWQADRLFAEHRPDMLMSGWDKRPWTRAVFKAWWSLASIEHIKQRHNAPIALGIVRRAAEYHWLKSRGCDIAVADLAPEKPAHFFNGDGILEAMAR